MIAAVALLAAFAAIPNIDVRDLGGHAVRIETEAAPATVVVFLSTVCPIANDYHDRFDQLYSRFQPKGARFVFVYANYNESDEEVRRHATEARFPFPVYRDPEARLAAAVSAQVTPTAVVLDGKGAVRYTGAIDDAVNPARVRSPYLADAVEAVLAGRDPSPAATRAEG
ncbi:MAG: redoxin family protein [Bryobacteraceae bacterium]